MKPADVVHEILSVYRRNGHRMYGESITETQHALQCATFAQREGQSPEIIVASLLHDYGHLLHDLGEDVADKGIDTRHEHVGANRLSAWFPPSIVEPIRLHAASKRYLCFKEAGYFEDLSDASRKSLALQGGPMSPDEAAAFERLPQFEIAVTVRRYDDRGKDPDMITPPMEAFAPLIESFVVR
jgi:hypothetical protein